MSSAVKRGTPQTAFKMGGRSAMSDVAEMENKRKTEKMLRAEKTVGLQKHGNLPGLRKVISTRVLLTFSLHRGKQSTGKSFPASPRFRSVKFKCLHEKLDHSQSISSAP